MNIRASRLVVPVMCILLLAAGTTVAAKYTETVTNQAGDEITFDMVLIEGGSFRMGSNADEIGRKADEGPVRNVQVEPFYLCTTETTLALFLAYYEETNRAKASHAAALKASKKGVDALTGPTPVFGELTMGYSKQNPAMGMTWHNAVNFCQWLSKKTGKTYRLPTEAEWEYAARAGTNNIYGIGNDSKDLGDYAWFDDNSNGETQPVAQKKPNAWGLYDMAGNVREWVSDFYSATAYADGGIPKGKVHVARGGDYNSLTDELRCASRSFEEKWWRDGDPQIPKSIWWLPNIDIVGFRIARSAGTADSQPKKLAFVANDKGEYTFDTGVLRGTLRKGGKSLGLSSVVHVPSGERLDGGTGICGYYRIFTTDKRYGSAGWGWDSDARLLDDGAVEVTWAAAEDRPFELVSVYRLANEAAIDVETTVKATKDLSKFEVFLSSYFNKLLPVSHVYVNENPEAQGKTGFLPARKSFGIWQMYPRQKDAVTLIKDGRWTKQPNPVDWAILPEMKAPLGVRRGEGTKASAVLMAPREDCFAISTPYEGEGHYSMYLSLFGADVKAGQSARAKARFAVADSASDSQVLKLYENYISQN